VAGRTDHLPMHVASGSYVIPADIISAMGEGNSMAGFKIAKDIFSVKNITKGTPYGEKGLPYSVSAPRKAGGGGADSGQAANRTTGGGGADMGRAANPAPAARPNPVVRPQSRPVAAPDRGNNNMNTQVSTSSAPAQADRYTGLWDMINGGGKGAGYTNLGDMFNGGGMNASRRGPTTGVVAPAAGTAAGPAETPYQGTFFNKMKPLLGAIVGTGMGIGPVAGYTAGKGFQKDDQGQSKVGSFFGMAAGGATDGVPIVAAGGEYVIPPEDVVHIGGGDLDHGHKVLDAFVKKMRQKTIKTLQSLPGPKKD
jgi:hypothetical protein